MRLDILPIFKNEGQDFNFEFKADFSKLEVGSNEYPFEELAQIKGKAVNNAGTIEISGTVTAKCRAKCDRCLKDIEFTETAEFFHSINNENGSDDNNEVIAENNKVDLKHIAEMALIVEYPQKHICSEKCKGICLNCGANLNEHECDCNKKKIDPRLEKLKELLD